MSALSCRGPTFARREKRGEACPRERSLKAAISRQKRECLHGEDQRRRRSGEARATRWIELVARSQCFLVKPNLLGLRPLRPAVMSRARITSSRR